MVVGAPTRSRSKFAARALLTLGAFFGAMLVGASPSSALGVVPPHVPAANTAERLPFACGPAVDNSTACTNSVLFDINWARRSEGVGPMVLPRGYAAMPVAEQMEVVTNLERVGRGLRAESGLDPSLNADALRGARADADPTPSRAVSAFASVWAGGFPSALAADYGWMYDDGPGGPNTACGRISLSGCWAHRATILSNYANPVMGAAEAATGFASWAEIFAPGPPSAPVLYPWTSIPPGPRTPQIVEIDPGGAVTGSVVTIDGLYFTGTTKVMFGAQPASFTISWDGALSVRVPPGIGTVRVTVTTGNGTAAALFAIELPPPLPEPIGGIASTPDGRGYWIINAQGGVRAFGAAINYGSMTGLRLVAPISHIVATVDGHGYWLVAADGGIFSFGDARFYGSMGGEHLNSPVVDIAPTHDGRGYWLVAGDGGVFSFGDAVFHGSMGGKHLNRPVVGLSAAGATGGYWEVASDGGIFAFDAAFHGSTGNIALVRPILSMAATTNGRGYWFVASDGGIFAFGNAAFHGSMGGHALAAPIVAMSADAVTGGYWMVGQNGSIYSFDAAFLGSN